MLRIKLPGGRVSPERPARDRRDLERVRPRRRRALHAAERPAALARARRAAGGLRPARTRPASPPPAAAATPSATSPAARSRASTPTSCSTPSRSSTRRPSSSTATPTTRTCRASTRSRSPPARDHCNAPEINCIALIGVVHDGRRGLRRPGRRRALVGAADRARPRRLRPEGGGGRGAARAARRVAGGPPLPGLAREGADEVHGRRLRRRRASAPSSSGGSAARSPTSRWRRPGALARPHRRPRAEAGGPRLHRRRPCTSASSPATR